MKIKKLFLSTGITLCCITQNRLKADTPYVTNPYQVDGFGSQFQNIIAAALYADLTHQQFVYSPFVSMEHNYDNDSAFLEKKEVFINFIDNFDVNTGQYPAIRNMSYKPVIDKHPDACAQSAMLTKIKTVFRAHKDVDNYFKNNRYNIVIHVRRPNQTDCRIEGTNTPDQLFLSIIEQLRIQYQDKNPLFHIHSQGNTENFKQYQADDVVLHLNKSVEDSFLAMVLADVLVAGASSFSYTAALLSDGIVYHIPFWHTPFPHWISVNDLLKNN